MKMSKRAKELMAYNSMTSTSVASLAGDPVYIISEKWEIELWGIAQQDGSVTSAIGNDRYASDLLASDFKVYSIESVVMVDKAIAEGGAK